jgi:hypothetical protein
MSGAPTAKSSREPIRNCIGAASIKSAHASASDQEGSSRCPRLVNM